MKINIKTRRSIDVKEVRSIDFREIKTIAWAEVKGLNVLGGAVKVKRYN